MDASAHDAALLAEPGLVGALAALLCHESSSVVEAAANSLCNMAAESAGRVVETVGRGGGGGGGGAPLAAAAATAVERAARRGFHAAGAAGSVAGARTEPQAWWAALQQMVTLLRRLAEVGAGASLASGDAA
jgi:hypothetical protein